MDINDRVADVKDYIRNPLRNTLPEFTRDLVNIVYSELTYKNFVKSGKKMYNLVEYIFEKELTGNQCRGYLKRLSRIGLISEPTVMVWIGFIAINMIRKNSELENLCNSREIREDDYDPDECLESLCKKDLRYVLWELRTYERHIYIKVEKMSRILRETQKNRQPMAIGSYNRMAPVHDVLIGLVTSIRTRKQRIESMEMTNVEHFTL